MTTVRSCQAEFAWLWQKGWNKLDKIAAICFSEISCPADTSVGSDASLSYKRDGDQSWCHEIKSLNSAPAFSQCSAEVASHWPVGFVFLTSR